MEKIQGDSVMSTLVDVAVPFYFVDVHHNDEYMNDAQKAHFRSLLETWRSHLLEEANTTLETMKHPREGLADEVDLASYEEDFRLVLRSRDRELNLIKKIDFSLQALKEGDYGYCEECGDTIGIGRLKARPTATKCVECKTVAELREKQLIND